MTLASEAATPDSRKVDFFISRRGGAAAVAQEVADILEAAGYTVFVQDKDIPVGANFVEAMHEAIDIGEKTLGRQHPNVIIAVLNLIALLQQTGRDSEAAALRARYGVPENGPK